MKACMGVCTVSPEPSSLAYTKHGSRGGLRYISQLDIGRLKEALNLGIYPFIIIFYALWYGPSRIQEHGSNIIGPSGFPTGPYPNLGGGGGVTTYI